MTNKCPIPEHDVCRFDWDKYASTLSRFDDNLKECERRIEKTCEEIKRRIEAIESQSGGRRLQALEDAVLRFFPEQRTILDQLKSGQDTLQQTIGALSLRMDSQESGLAGQETRIEALENVTKDADIKLAKTKHQIWQDKFRIRAGSAMLLIWIVGAFVRPYISKLSNGALSWEPYLVLGIAGFLFGQNAFRNFVMKGKE